MISAFLTRMHANDFGSLYRECTQLHANRKFRQNRGEGKDSVPARKTRCRTITGHTDLRILRASPVSGQLDGNQRGACP